GIAPARALVAAAHRRRLPTALSLHDYWYACPRATLFDWREEICAGPSPGRCGRCMGWPTRNPLRWLGRAQEQSGRRRAFRAVAQHCGVLVPVPEHVRRQYARLGAPADRMVVISPGVPPPAAPLPAPPAEGPLRVALLGRLVPEKGAHVLLA